MANPVILNKEAHRNLRVDPSRGEEFGENIHVVPVIGDELRNLVLDFPVCLIKDNETGQFGLSALLGFEPGENLYLQGSQWATRYVPLHMRRQPFLLAFTGADDEERAKNNALIAIDMDSKRINDSQGERLFNDDGSKSPYLDRIGEILAALAAGGESTSAFVSVLAEHDLIEPLQLNITFANGEKKRFEGLHTINSDKLADLKGDVLEQLNNRGFLQACYLLVASMGQVSRMIDLKNARHKAN